MGGYNRIFVADRMSIAQDEDTVLPSEIYLVIHQQSTCDCNSKTTFETEIVSVYYQFEDAVATASRYVRALFGMDEGDQEWLEMLDWQGKCLITSMNKLTNNIEAEY